MHKHFSGGVKLRKIRKVSMLKMHVAPYNQNKYVFAFTAGWSAFLVFSVTQGMFFTDMVYLHFSFDVAMR